MLFMLIVSNMLFMLIVVMVNVIMLSAVMVNVIMLSVVAPFDVHLTSFKKSNFTK